MNIILSSDSITKIYKNDVVDFISLYHFSAEIQQGSVNLVMGKSGSGKSTLLNILGGMDSPTCGDVYYKNINYYKLNDNEQAKIRGNNYGYIFQAYNLISELKIMDNILLPSIISKIDVDKKYFYNLIEYLDIQSKLDLFPLQLSGGEQQRVAIARALINKPEIIFADEPTGNLDEQNSKNVAKTLLELNKIYNLTLIIVTHDKDLIKSYDKLYMLIDGKVSIMGKGENIV